MTLQFDHRLIEDYGFARVRDLAFEAVRGLWDKRQSEGWTQAYLAQKLGRNPAWVSRKLSAPGNWTLRTFGAFVEALDGESEIIIHDLNGTGFITQNYNAYSSRSLSMESATRINVTPQMTSETPSANSNSVPVEELA